MFGILLGAFLVQKQGGVLHRGWERQKGVNSNPGYPLAASKTITNLIISQLRINQEWVLNLRLNAYDL